MRRVIGEVMRHLLPIGLTVGLLVGAELVLVTLQLPKSLFTGDPASYWSLRPHLEEPAVPFREEGTSFPVRTNAMGLRDGPLPESGPWAIAFGCSTTFGWGVSAEESWPEQLEARLRVPVVNAGVPGHSTVQGLRHAADLLARKPDVAVLGWIVRDAQLATRPDRDAVPTRFPFRTHLFQWLLSLRPRSEPPELVEGVPRVPPDEFLANLQVLVAQAREHGVNPLVLAFPMQEPATAHLAVLDRLDVPVLRPELPADAFFANDPVHLTPEGHRLLAEAVEEAVRDALP